MSFFEKLRNSVLELIDYAEYMLFRYTLEIQILIIALLTFIVILMTMPVYSEVTPSVSVPGPRVPTYAIGHLCSVTDPDFDEYRYIYNISHCKRAVSSATKKNLYKLYNIEQCEHSNYTIDHIVPLSIGGSNSTKNLWPEHLALKEHNGTLEWDLFTSMRDGSMPQAEAVWIVKYVKFSTQSPRYFPGYITVLRKRYADHIAK